MSDVETTVLGWALRSAVAGSVVLLVGFVIVRAARSPALKQRAAAWTVRAAVLVPALCLLPGWWSPPVLGARVAVSEAMVSAPIEPPGEGLEPEFGWDGRSATAPIVDDAQLGSVEVALPEVTKSATGATSAVSVWPTILPFLLIPYAVLAVLFLGQLVLGQLGLIRLRQASRPASARVREIYHDLTADDPEAPPVLVSERLATPICFGLFRPAIVVPKSLAKSATEAELRWVLAHELEHVRRGDPATGWWVGLARAVYFFVPWFWPVRRDLGLAQEYLADAAAAAVAGQPADYAAFLVTLSGTGRRLGRTPLPAHGVRAGGSDLFRRVHMLLVAGPGVRRAHRGWAAVTAALVLTAAVVASGFAPAVADDEKPKPKPVETKPAAPKPPAAPEAPKPPIEVRIEGRIDGEPTDGGSKLPFRVIAAENIGELKDKIAEAAKKGDLDGVKKLVEQLEKALSGPRMVPPMPPMGERRPAGDAPRPETRVPPRPEGPQPPVPPLPPRSADLRRFEIEVMPRIEGGRETIERGMKALQEALEKAKDPATREALEHAIRDYKKAVEEGMKKVEEFRRLEVRPGIGNAPRIELREHAPPTFGIAPAPVPEIVAEQFDLPRGKGLIVNEVIKGSVAEKAGVKKNDIVLAIGGKDVSGEPGQFPELLSKVKPGEKFDVVVLRKGKKEVLKAELPEAPKVEGQRRVVVVSDADIRDAKKPAERATDKLELRLNDRNPATPRVQFEQMSVSINNGEFTIDAKKGDVKYSVRGEMKDGKPTNTSIVIATPKDKMQFKNPSEVPEEHRDAVRQLMGSVNNGR